jgi:hypothetical protein
MMYSIAELLGELQIATNVSIDIDILISYLVYLCQVHLFTFIDLYQVLSSFEKYLKLCISVLEKYLNFTLLFI